MSYKGILRTFDRFNKIKRESKDFSDIKSVQITSKGSNPFIGTLDIETASLFGIRAPIAIGVATFNTPDRPGSAKSYINNILYDTWDILKDYNINLNKEDVHLLSNNMIVNSILRIIDKYNHYTFYCHNFGRYDYIFILKRLVDYNELVGDINDKIIIIPVYRDNIVMKLTLSKISIVNGKKTTNTIVICDSLLLLNASLKKLGSAYNLDCGKGLFPYEFVNETTVNYIGATPDIKYFGVSPLEYETINYPYYSIYEVLLHYLWLDLQVHLLIMESFRKEVIVYLDKT
uniref:Probable DNA polymerase n=1 Tax=Candida corydali TaxID=391826 RepID=S5TGH7_9ASCO|nr:hypothetical protein [Candida corydali]AGS44537.1 hypothetical protein [Candida corydali]